MAAPIFRVENFMSLLGRSWERLRTFSRRLTTIPSFDITENEINKLPRVTFTGKTEVISSPSDETKYQNEINEIQRAAVVGFDTESFIFSSTPRHPCLIQLASSNTVLLWRLKRRNNHGGYTMWLSPTLVDILTCPNILKVGHAVCTNDAVAMLTKYHVDMKNFNDTILLASQLGIRDASLRKLVALFMRQRLCKGQRLSNWEKRLLIEEQISYASADAWASLKVYEFMIRHASDNNCTLNQPMKRAWDLLKQCEQEAVSKKLARDEVTVYSQSSLASC